MLSRLTAYSLPIASVLIIMATIRYPDLAFQAALYGLNLWWNVVFPALLPFFIGSELLLGLGVVNGMGVILEPLMRPVFNVPGVGSFVLAMGLASGYPIGSILTAKLRRQNLLSKTEGERLMSFCNTADPLFISGAVAVGMFDNPSLGGVLLAAHYLSAIGTGLLLRFHGHRDSATAPGPATSKRGSLLVRALTAMDDARTRDGRPFGQLLGDAVHNSINTLLLIGGLIILFAVIIRVLTAVGIVSATAGLLAALLAPIGMSKALAPSLVSGFFEITIGAQQAAHSGAPLSQALAVTSAVIAWSGLSVLAQVASIVQGTGMSLRPYLLARAVQAALAAAVTLFLLGPAGPVADHLLVPAYLELNPVSSVPVWLDRIEGLGGLTLWFMGGLTAVSLVLHSLNKLRAAVRR